jgi:hypothetical protein
MVLSMLLLLFFINGCAHHTLSIEGEAVVLSLKAPDAESVLFVSSLDGYEMHKAVRSDDDTWVVRVPAMRAFSYFYIVDGEVFVPDCSFSEPDDFGSRNCIFAPGM